MRKIKKTQPKVEVENPQQIPAKVIADAIVSIAESMKQINRTRLTNRAIVALIHEESKIAKSTIQVVLNNLSSLEDTWLRKNV